jgi:hypothetical protein
VDPVRREAGDRFALEEGLDRDRRSEIADEEFRVGHEENPS